MNNQTQLHACEHCGRPSTGANRCPHAINKRYDCPNNPNKKTLRKHLRHIGTHA